MPSTTGKDIRLANRYSQENRKSAPNPPSDSTKWLRLFNAEAEMTIQQIAKGEISVGQSAACFTEGPVERMADGHVHHMLIYSRTCPR